MAQKLETAHISFGLVTIPVGIYSAIQEQDLHFNQLHGVCGSRIKQRRFCPTCNGDIEYPSDCLEHMRKMNFRVS
jgi:DNA end-binding protein Ku